MGTYCKMDVKYYDGSTKTFEIKGESDWISETILECPLWENKDGKKVIFSNDKFDEFMDEDLYGWESNPTSCIEYYFFVDCSNLENSYWCETDFNTTKPVGKPMPLILCCIRNTSKCVKEYIDSISSRLNSDTAQDWLEANREFSFVKGKEIIYHLGSDNKENPLSQIPTDIKISDTSVDIYFSDTVHELNSLE